MKIEWKGEGLNEIGYNLNSNKPIIKVSDRYFRPTEVETLLGDITKARKELGWQPRVTIDQLIQEMVDTDKKIAREELVLKESRSRKEK